MEYEEYIQFMWILSGVQLNRLMLKCCMFRGIYIYMVGEKYDRQFSDTKDLFWGVSLVDWY